MSIIRGNLSFDRAEVGMIASKGIHTVAKPTDVGGLGQYRMATATGAIAAGAQTDAEVLQFRWVDATKLCLIKRVEITGARATTAFAAGAVDIKLTQARTFTAVGSGTGSVTTAPIVLAATSVNASGVLTFTALSIPPKVGQTITINGTMSTGTINGTGAQSNAVYYVVGTPTATTATLSLTVGGSAVASTASTGAFTGCTSTLSSLLAGNGAKLRSTFAASAAPVIVTAGTAVLSAGTKLLDTIDTSWLVGHTSAGPGAATPIIGSSYLPTTTLFKADVSSGEYPILFRQDEGFAIRVSCPGTGVWSIGFVIHWAEVTEF
jgi:hypothetical protein